MSCSNISITHLPHSWHEGHLTCLAVISGQHKKKKNPEVWIAQYYRNMGKVHSRFLSVIPQRETRTTTSAFECRKIRHYYVINASWKMFKSVNLLCLVQSIETGFRGSFDQYSNHCCGRKNC